MALDEALLETAAQGVYSLRFYRWRAPTLSLGYFQPISDRTTHAASRDCPLVRRTTGGGAILHDQEWTYSFAAPAGSPLAVDALPLYRQVHQALIDALGECGIRNAEMRNGERTSHSAFRIPNAAFRIPPEPFLCFQRRAAGDVMLGEAKIAGSAQRRRRGALLQHGSLILRTSAAAPEISGLCELAQSDQRPVASGERQSLALDEECLRLAWQAGIAERLRLRLTVGEVTAQEQAAAEQLVREKYGHALWNERR